MAMDNNDKENGQELSAAHRSATSVGEALVRRAEKGEVGFFTSYNSEGRFISYYGDNHPQYAGNVVKAMASAKHGYRHVVELFTDELSALDPAAQPVRDAARAAHSRPRAAVRPLRPAPAEVRSWTRR